MRFVPLFAATVAIAGTQQVAIGQSAPAANQVSMCVTTAIGTCGSFCEPFNCRPNYSFVSSHERVRFDIGGGLGSPYVLFFGVAVPGCMTIPGIGGQLATWSPTIPLTMGWLTDQAVNLNYPCEPATDVYYQRIPRVPPGVNLRFQLLGVNAARNLPTGEELTFSRPTEIRTR